MRQEQQRGSQVINPGRAGTARIRQSQAL